MARGFPTIVSLILRIIFLLCSRYGLKHVPKSFIQMRFQLELFCRWEALTSIDTIFKGVIQFCF